MARYFLNLSACLAALTACIATPVAARDAQAGPADVILEHGSIYRVEPKGTWAQALAVRDGKIVAIGSDQEVDRLKGPNTRVVDLRQRMVMPGMIDAHIHLGMAASVLQTYKCNFSAYGDFDAVLSSVRECASRTPPGEWILGESWGSGLYARLSDPSALRALDEASGDHPVMLRNDSIHDRWVNSKALQIAGITAKTPDPVNGKIGRDPATGALNGLLMESAAALVESHIPAITAKPTVADEAKGLEVGVQYLNSIGVTGFNDAVVLGGFGNYSDLRAYKMLDERGGLTANAALSLLVDQNTPSLDDIIAQGAAIESPQIDAGFAKIFVDGVMVSHTATFLEPYLPDDAHGANFRGDPKISQERLTAMVKQLDRRGVSIKLHTAGDGAVAMALNAIAAARTANGKTGPMHTLAHAGYIADRDIPRVRALNVAIDASPTVWYPGPILAGTEAVIGEKRARRYWPFRTFEEQGVVVAGGTDWKTLPGEFSSLWDGMEGLVTRKNPTGAAPGTLWPEEAVDVATMIEFYTINSARALGISKRTGSIEVGKDADLIVLDRNLFEISPDDIADTKVDLTFFRGKTVYERADEGSVSDAGAAAVERAAAAWLAAINAGDYETGKKGLADDAAVIGPDGPVVLGRTEVDAQVAALTRTEGFKVDFTPERSGISADGQIGFVVGQSAISVATADGKRVPQRQRLLLVWRKQPSGEWKCIFNVPMGAPLAPPK